MDRRGRRDERRPRRRSGRAARWILPFAGYFLLFAAWATATPYDGTPDEMRHVIRAYGVASGEFAPAPAHEGRYAGAYHDVPRSLVRTNCFAFHTDRPASCARPPGGDESTVRTLTPAGRYNPTYYLAVGWPLVLSPNMVGVLLARLVSAALVAGLFAAATAVALSMRRRGALAGLPVALTPITAHLAGAVNPNGVEIAAGAALVMALIAILYDAGEGARGRAAWWLGGVSGGVLLLVRPAGPAWFAVIALVMLVPLPAVRYRELLRSRRAWALAGALAVTGLAAASWTVWKRADELTPNRPPARHLSLVDGMKIEFFGEWRRHVTEMVGVLSWLDTPLPIVVHLAWWMALGSLVMSALAVGRAVDRWRVAGLGGLGMLVPSLIEASNVNEYGFVAQGRYHLPMLVGVPILAGYVITARGGYDPTPRLARLFVIILLPAHVGALWYLMIRYQVGLSTTVPTPPLNPFAGSWRPALGPALPLLLAVASTALFIRFYWRVTAGGADPIARDGDGADVPSAPG